MVLTSGGSTTSTNIEIEALDEQHELENLEYLRQTAGLPPLFSSQARLNPHDAQILSNTLSNMPNAQTTQNGQTGGLNNGVQLNLPALMNNRFDNQMLSAFNEILSRLTKQSKDIIDLQQNVNSIQQQVLMQVYQSNTRRDPSTTTKSTSSSNNGSGNTPSSPLKEKSSGNASNESLDKEPPINIVLNHQNSAFTANRPNTLPIITNFQSGNSFQHNLQTNLQHSLPNLQNSRQNSVSNSLPQFTGFPSDDDDQESKSHGLPLSMAARYVIDSKRSVTRFIRAISRRLFPEFFGPNATGIPRQYNVSGRHGKQKLDPVRYNIIIRITNRFWANTVDFPYSNVPEPIIRRAVDGLLRCKDNRRSLPMHLQEAWDKLYPHDT